jgi:hypothetical protein
VIPIVSLLVVLTISLLVTRVAAVALVHTGLSREVARFQARSAFTGVGFTTGESESIVGHPVRRRITMSLMLFGNVGTVAALSSTLLSFIGLESGGSHWRELVLLLAGLATLLLVAASRRVDAALSNIISWALRRFTELDTHDYAHLLHLQGEYGVAELRVDDAAWLAGVTIGESRLAAEGVLVLGVECPGDHFIGAPPSDTQVRSGDRLILYGRAPRIAELDARADRSGESMHRAAVEDNDRIVGEELSRAGR